MPPPPSNVLTNPIVRLDRDLNFVIPSGDDTRAQKRGIAVTGTKQGNAILISGCRENQTSADAWIGGRYHGALSYYLVEALASANFNITYDALIKDINVRLRNMKYTQVPQLECKPEFFNQRFLNN
jgi:hypothetical protein